MFRFTIRDVLWLTVVVALAVAWWMDRRSQQSETEHWVRKAFALYGALEAREEMIGWDDLDSAQAILESPTNTHPTISDGGKFVEASK